MRVLGIPGSLRAGSYNLMALKAAQRLAPEGMTITLAGLAGIPFYDEDLRASGEPEAVTQLKEAVHAADAVLIASPEYNFSVPGVLKNALDWLSRPPNPPFERKPVGIIGASMGPLGTARGQYHLRQILVYMNSFTVNKPEVFIGFAQNKFDADGTLTDAATGEFIAGLLTSLKEMAELVGRR